VLGYEPLIAQCTNDVGDRHVLAAAIKAQASRILTFNLVDFPAEALSPWGITALHPQDYLLELYAKDREAVRDALEIQAHKQGMKVEEWLAVMAQQVPAFSHVLLAAMGTR